MSNASFEKLNPDEAGAIVGTTRSVISTWIKRGWLKAINVGAGTIRPRWQINRDDLDETIKELIAEGQLTSDGKVKNKGKRSRSKEVATTDTEILVFEENSRIEEVKANPSTTASKEAYISEILEENRSLRKKIDELKSDLEAARKANKKLNDKNKKILNDILEVLSSNE